MKKYLYLTFALLLLPLSTKAAFKDVPSYHPHIAAINYVWQEGVVSGYEDGTYRPDQTINRAEFIKIITLYRYGQTMVDMCGTGHYYSDLSRSAWYYKYFCRALDDHLIEGYPNGTMRPGQNINAAEAIKLIAIADDGLHGYRGMKKDESNPWYLKYVEYLASKNAIPLQIQSVGADLTRGQMAEMIYRLSEEVTHLPSHTALSLTGYGGGNSLIQPIEMTYLVHPTLGLFKLVLYPEKKEVVIYNDNNKTELILNFLPFNEHLEQLISGLQSGNYQLQDFYQIVDIDNDGFKDIRAYSLDVKTKNKTVDALYYFNGQTYKYDLYNKAVPSTQIDNQGAYEYCSGPVSSRYALPINQQYAHFGDLGRLFTASDCGTLRYQSVLGFFPGEIDKKLEIRLYQKPSWDLYNALYGIGFYPSDSSTNSAAESKIWIRHEVIKTERLIALKQFADQISSITDIFGNQ